MGTTRERYRAYPVQYSSDPAAWRYNYGISLRACGLPGSARDADAEAELMQELCRARPDQYRNDLATRLQNYSSTIAGDQKIHMRGARLNPDKCRMVLQYGFAITASLSQLVGYWKAREMRLQRPWSSLENLILFILISIATYFSALGSN